MAEQSKYKRNTLYYPLAGVDDLFEYFEQNHILAEYDDYVFIDTLPNIDWMEVQDREKWIKLCKDNSTLTKLHKNLSNLFGEGIINKEESFIYFPEHSLKYYYSTNIDDFEMVSEEGNGIVIKGSEFLLQYDDEKLTEQVLRFKGNIHLFYCQCGECNDGLGDYIADMCHGECYFHNVV